MSPRRPHRPGPGDTQNTTTAQGDYSIAAGSIRNVIVRWAMQHPSARWLPLILACAGLILAGTTWPDGPATQYVLWGILIALALATAAARVLVQRPRDARIVAALSLVSVLATVGGWLAFRSVATHGEIDVTGKVAPLAQRSLTNGARYTLTLDIDAPKESRNTLRLTLAIDDHDRNGPTCRPDSSAELTLLPSGDMTRPATVRHGGTAEFPLGAQVRTARVSVELTTAPGCRLDIRTTHAALYDK
ncbi:hypothetical protein [Streptomyces sp. NPDC093707]|uniref:hypothetical protein n=1 Tax=Streptomyces sp. NPDC093707 TaxID=3154984 RepID=UPI00344FC2F9